MRKHLIVILIMLLTIPAITVLIASHIDQEKETSDGQIILDNDWEVQPPMAVEFRSDNDKLVGKLWFGEGVMKFEGNMEESAELFFEHFLKQIADEYIKERLELCRSELWSMAMMVGRTDFMPFINYVFNKERQ